MNKSRIITSLTTIILTSAIAVNCLTSEPKAIAADPSPTNAQIKSLYSEKCSACHDLPDPDEKGFTKDQWQSTVNRMMNAHNARTSISDDQAAEIVVYLGQFAPKPGANNAALNGIGVWQYDPVESVSYPFTYGPNIGNFDIHGGTWKVIETKDIFSGYLKNASTGDAPAVLLENKHNFEGALDLQTEFHINQSEGSSAVGLVFGAVDEKNYLAAEYNPSSGDLALVRVTNGVPSVLQQTPSPTLQTVSSDSWHTLRVKITEDGANAEVSLDYQRLLKTTDPGWKNGRVGLISIGPIVAGFRQLTIDSYQSSARQPSGDVLLH